MTNKTFLCPNCRRPLALSKEARQLDRILMSLVECQECGADVIIEDDVPRLLREDEPD